MTRIETGGQQVISASSVTFLLAGRYRLEHRRGSGGFGEVWRGTDTVLARPVAVKLLRAEFAQDPVTLARFRDEARHAGRLAHENIVRVYDYEAPSPADPPFLVMEFVDGPSLAEVLANGPLEPWKVMDLVAQAAAGLHAAHQAGLVHRDIKPENILFTREGTVKLTDFGIARAAGSASVTASGALLGTPAYLAPEWVAGEKSTAAGDLYALGVVAYQCLTGGPPFGGTAIQVALAQRSHSMPPLPTSIPGEVAELVSHLTAKDPATRPRSAGEVACRAGALRDGIIPGPGAAQPGQADAWTVGLPAAGRQGALDEPTQPWRLPGRRRYGRSIVLSAAVVVAVAISLLLAGVFDPGPRRAAAAAPAAPAKVTTVEVHGNALKGRPVDAVREHLRRLGLVVRVRWRSSDQQAAGWVLAVHPTGRVPSGSTVVVIGALQSGGPAANTPPGESAPRARRQDHSAGRGQRRQRAGNPTPAGSPSATPSSPSPTSSPSPSGSPTPPAGPTPAPGSTAPAAGAQTEISSAAHRDIGPPPV